MYKKLQFPSNFFFEPTSLHKKIIEKSNNDQMDCANYFVIQQVNNQSISKASCKSSYSTSNATQKETITSSNEDYQFLTKRLYASKKESEFGFSVRGGQDVGFMAKIAFINSGKCFYFLF